MTRRTLLIGAGTGVVGVLLASCMPEPAPSPTPDTSPTPKPTGATLTPAAFVRSVWTTDPFSLGAASFTPVGSQPSARAALATPVENRLFLTGEATDPDAPGTMSGAWHSGERAARDVAEVANAGERVAVIGAGLAGAVAASRLSVAGFDVTVFEARDRIGGRVHSLVDEDEWPFPAQLGGWLLGSADGELLNRVNLLDVRTVPLAVPLWRSADAAPGEDADVEPQNTTGVLSAIEAAQQLPTDSSLAQALEDAGADLEDPALAALLAALAATTGAAAQDLSSWFPPAVSDDERTAPLGDYGPIFDGLLEGIRVSLSSPVSRVAYDEAGVSLGIATGESLSFDRVVISVPLGVLQSDGLQFAPALPFSYRGAIADLGMGHIETVWLRFDEPVTETDADIWHVVGGEALIRTWLNLAPSTGANVLVGIVGAEAADEFAELDDQAVLDAALASLTPFVDV